MSYSDIPEETREYMVVEVFEKGRDPLEVAKEYQGNFTIMPEHIFNWKLHYLATLPHEEIQKRISDTDPEKFPPLDYPIYTPPHNGDLKQMGRKEARICYKHFLATIEDRIEILKEFLGVGDRLDYSMESMKLLDELFPKIVLSCKFSAVVEKPSKQVLSFARDVGIYRGNAVTKNVESVHWEFYTRGKTFAAYQRPVLMGYDLPSKTYCVDPIGGLQTYAFRLAAIKQYAIEAELFSKAFWSSLNKKKSAEQTMKKVQEIMKSVEESVAAQEAEEQKLKKKKGKANS
jgi:hypothetical protein